jgi:hypothetical protein
MKHKREIKIKHKKIKRNIEKGKNLKNIKKAF